MRRHDDAGSAVLVTVVLIVLGYAALRLVTLLLALAAGDVGLHVDEAQYWHWSTQLAWGYYSKPPAIAVLLAGSTALFGDGVLTVKSVGLLLFPLTGGVLGLLAGRLARDSGLAARPAAALAAALFMASPLAAVLGLAATTDAPLLLCWSLATALLWHLRQSSAAGRATPAGWLALGLVCGIGLLSKYTFAAWIAGAWIWCWQDRDVLFADPRSARRGLAGAAAVTLALLLPHLAWNAAMGWPTLHHTAEITAVAPRGLGDGGGWSTLWPSIVRSLMVPLGVLVMAGPVIVPVCRRAMAGLRRRDTATRYLVTLHTPLLLLGMLQALRGVAQLNWVAPVVPGLVLLLALRTADAWAGTAAVWRRRVLLLALALQTGLCAAVPLAQPMSQVWHIRVDPEAPALPRRLDLWARMRGWPQALATLRPSVAAALAQSPDAAVVTTSRSVVAIAAHAWRDLPVPWRAWSAGGPAHSHYELTARWPGPFDRPGPVLVLADAPLPAELLARLDAPELLARADAPAGGHSTVTLWLWRAHARP
ncbi:ArnT family glycosyltransferase [Leptothrix sp. BB-4]